MVYGSWRSDPETKKWHVFVASKTECEAGTVVEVYSRGTNKTVQLIVQSTIKSIKGGNLYHCKSLEKSEVKPIYDVNTIIKVRHNDASPSECTTGGEVTAEELDAALGLWEE